MNVLFLSNGCTACFDENGQQVAELQKPWVIVFAEFLKSKGIDPFGIKLTLPDGYECQYVAIIDPDTGKIDHWGWR